MAKASPSPATPVTAGGKEKRKNNASNGTGLGRGKNKTGAGAGAVSARVNGVSAGAPGTSADGQVDADVAPLQQKQQVWGLTYL